MRPKRELIAPPARLAVGAQVEVTWSHDGQPQPSPVKWRSLTSPAPWRNTVCATMTALAATGTRRRRCARRARRASHRRRRRRSPSRRRRASRRHRRRRSSRADAEKASPPPPQKSIVKRPAPTSARTITVDVDGDKVELHADFADAVLKISAVRAQRVQQKFLGTPRGAPGDPRAQLALLPRDGPPLHVLRARAAEDDPRDARQGQRRPRAAVERGGAGGGLHHLPLPPLQPDGYLRAVEPAPQVRHDAGYREARQVGGGARLAHQGGPRRVPLRAARVSTRRA